MLGELEHRQVAVRVANSDDRPSAGAAPDPDWFLLAIVEIVGFVGAVPGEALRRR